MHGSRQHSSDISVYGLLHIIHNLALMSSEHYRMHECLPQLCIHDDTSVKLIFPITGVAGYLIIRPNGADTHRW